MRQPTFAAYLVGSLLIAVIDIQEADWRQVELLRCGKLANDLLRFDDVLDDVFDTMPSLVCRAAWSMPGDKYRPGILQAVRRCNTVEHHSAQFPIRQPRTPREKACAPRERDHMIAAAVGFCANECSRLLPSHAIAAGDDAQRFGRREALWLQTFQDVVLSSLQFRKIQSVFFRKFHC